jgi:hypothetical protein
VIAAWIGPRLNPAWPLVTVLRAPATSIVSDPAGFLGADLTTLGVIIAILIGYNVAAFQIAADAVALGLVRAILLTLIPFIFVWVASSAVTLIYFLATPPCAGNLWQVGLWFGATAFLLIGYLVGLPRKLSGDYAARWALKDLAPVPIAEWESTDGFTVLQAGLGTAVGRADVGTVRLLAIPVGRAFAGRLDREAERHPGFLRPRMYALRNLFAGCAPYRTTLPSAIAYNLGYAAAGVLLQGADTGHSFTHPNGGLVDAIIPSGTNVPELSVALWAGLRHALCRRELQGAPYLRRYWVMRKSWPNDTIHQSQLTAGIAEGLFQLHAACWHEVELAGEQAKVATVDLSEHAPELLSEFYRYLAQYFARDAQQHLARKRTKRRLVELARDLLVALQQQVETSWPSDLPATVFLKEQCNERRQEIEEILQSL